MLVQFSVGNFLSFKDVATLSMVASSIKEFGDTNLFKINDKLNLLKSTVIYGANASGKSNLFKGMAFARNFILNSSKETQATEDINITNFKLSVETENMPSFFEFIFIQEGIRYRYGFQVNKTEVCEEWLFYTPKTKEVKLFIREKNTFQCGSSFKESKDLKEKTRKNALFLSVVAQFNGEISTKILTWFTHFHVVSGLNDTNFLPYTLRKLEEETFKDEILRFLKIADLGIENIYLIKKEIDLQKLPADLPEQIKSELVEGAIQIGVQTSHIKYDKEKNIKSHVKFELDEEESKGTQKFFALSAPIIDTLKNGKILVIDELDARLHPLLTKYLIRLFNSNEHNKFNAQLIFVSHDTNLLNRDLFRRDQIWFTEKNREGATNLYSLVEYKVRKVRKDASFEKDYILGKYGAIPFINELDSWVE